MGNLTGENVSAILFDLDGTFADTAPDMTSALNIMRREKGFPPLPVAEVRRHVSHGARGMLQVGFGVGPQHEKFADLRDSFYDIYQDIVCVDSMLFDGIDAVINHLDRHEICWGIVTNKAARFALPIAKKLGFSQRAKCIVCGDTTAHTKPHPAPLLHAASLTGIAPKSTLYVGDDERDIQAARAAGMRSVAAIYGYLGTSADPLSWGADFYISAPSDLSQMLGV